MTKRQIYRAMAAASATLAAVPESTREKFALAMDSTSCTLQWAMTTLRALEKARKRLQEAKANDTTARAVAYDLVKLLEG